MMFVSCLVTLVLVVLTFFIVVCVQRNKLNAIKNQTEKLHHDISSSLVIIKLTLENLKDFPLENKEKNSVQQPSLISLVNLLEEGLRGVEDSFRHWSLSHQSGVDVYE